MANEVSICNAALAHLGDRAAVTSINPPDQSVQASLCAQFYPMARDALIELHNWGFSKRRASLAEVDNPSTTWAYAYSPPSGMVNLISILDADAKDDYSAPGRTVDLVQQRGVYTPQDFDVETLDDGSEIILTNVVSAVCRYTAVVLDASKFSPTFNMTLSWLLASMLAGPLLKGDRGMAAELACLKVMNTWLNRAATSDSDNRQVRPVHQVEWVNARA